LSSDFFNYIPANAKILVAPPTTSEKEEKKRHLGIILKSKKKTFALTLLVDPASSHMLISRVKPCMSKRNWKKKTFGLRMAHYISNDLLVKKTNVGNEKKVRNLLAKISHEKQKSSHFLFAKTEM